jgi:hypothetical protein
MCRYPVEFLDAIGILIRNCFFHLSCITKFDFLISMLIVRQRHLSYLTIASWLVEQLAAVAGVGNISPPAHAMVEFAVARHFDAVLYGLYLYSVFRTAGARGSVVG